MCETLDILGSMFEARYRPVMELSSLELARGMQLQVGMPTWYIVEAS